MRKACARPLGAGGCAYNQIQRNCGASKGGGRKVETDPSERKDAWLERSDAGDDTRQGKGKS
jgi:hypothetical protein